MGWTAKPITREVRGLSGALQRRVSARLTRRRFLRLMGQTVVGAALAGGGGWIYASEIEPHWYRLENVELTLPRLAPAFDGFRLAQISDIHLSESTTGERLAEVIQTVQAQSPDLVAITGDYVDRAYGLHDSVSILVDILRPLAQQVPVVTVLGNHDYWVGPASIRAALTTAAVMELPNFAFPIRRGSSTLYIGGVDDVWEGRARLSHTLRHIPEDGQAAILLAHEPDFADSAAMSGRFDLQISGHTHGGQVVLPFFGPPILPRYGQKYTSGLYQVGRMLQYTNRGIGTISPRVRFNCRPEITLFTLRSKQP